MYNCINCGKEIFYPSQMAEEHLCEECNKVFSRGPINYEVVEFEICPKKQNKARAYIIKRDDGKYMTEKLSFADDVCESKLFCDYELAQHHCPNGCNVVGIEVKVL